MKDEYIHKKSGRRFCHIVAGIGWAGARPGFVVVLGLETNYKLSLHAYLLGEREADSTWELLRSCTELKTDCHVQTFYSNTTDKQNVHILSAFNKKTQEQHKSSLLIEAAPFSQDGISYHINLLLHRLDAGNKTLHFSLLPESKLPSYLQEIQSGDVHDAKAKDHPAIAALGFAVSALTDLELLEDNAYEKDELNNRWDPFDY